MPDRHSVLISIRQEYVDSIIDGKKRAEIRRLFPTGENLSRVYVYVPTPKMHVVGYFDIKEIKRLPINQLWESAGEESALSRESFYGYLSGKEIGISIHFEDFVTLKQKSTLAIIRRNYPNFHPPQSFMYVTTEMERLFLSKYGGV